MDQPPRLESLANVRGAMTAGQLRVILARIRSRNYPKEAYMIPLDFVKDVAALSLEHAGICRRKCGKTTVLKSLGEACKSAKVQYLLNLSRFAFRNPGLAVGYGTIGCEQVHGEIAAHYRSGIVQQSVQYAAVFAKIFTIKKIVSGAAQRATYNRNPGQGELLSSLHGALRHIQLEPGCGYDIAAGRRPHVDLSEVPNNAVFPARIKRRERVLRARPVAQTENARVLARPAHSDAALPLAKRART